jgi:hypothetical protein
MEQSDDDPFDERGLLKDGHTYRVPARMLDGMQRSIAAHFQRRRASDSAAFPRPRERCYVVDGQGGTQGLHRPGYRLAAGGHAGDKALRDATDDECQRAYDRYQYDLTNAWRHRDAMPAAAEPDDVEVEIRVAAIRNALIKRGHNVDDVEDWLSGLQDDEVLDNDIGEHIAAFEDSLNSRDARTLAVDRKIRLIELYQERDAELSQQWRRR